ncbi:MAG: hypothetical protein LBQ71_13925 [Hungatella sp.]|jgi:hypothetical protein|nr:hypothetical protein [Hungatella sp.]
MNNRNFTDFFDPEVQKTASEDGCSIYRLQNETGEGVITRYQILPGIELFYYDFHMRDGQNKNKLPYPDIFEINRLTNETKSTTFPLSHYHGISITIDLYTMPICPSDCKSLSRIKRGRLLL